MFAHRPLPQRIVRSHSQSRTIIGLACESRGPYRQWAEENLSKAMTAVEKGVSLRRTAEMYSIPKSTLHDHVTGKVMLGAKAGPTPYLTPLEEEELVSFLINTARIGYSHTIKQILHLVQQIVDDKGIDTIVTYGWWERFRKRHPSLTVRVAVPFSLSRAIASDPEMLDRYFDMLEECLKQNELLDKAPFIFNCDESGMPLNPKSLKVVDRVGTKNPSYITGSDKTQLTILACTSAAGYAMPPFVIFDRMKLNPKHCEGEVPGTLYGLSHNGWMNQELFHYWFLHHFLEYAPTRRPIILLLDGHSSHYCPETIKLAAEEKVIMFALPPHTTHITQPLDKGCFSPLKVVWRQVCHEWCVKHPGRVVTRFEFSKVFSKAWFQAMTVSNIVASFRTTGICPFNRSITVPGDCKEFASFKPESLAEKSGLAYIPLYSPARSSLKNLSPSGSYHSSPLLTGRLSRSYSDPYLNQDFSFDESFYDSFEVHVSPFGSPSNVPLRNATSTSKHLIPLVPLNKEPTKREKSHGKVLTSREMIEMMDKKAKEKATQLQQKELRKKAREEKKAVCSKSKKTSKIGMKCVYSLSLTHTHTHSLSLSCL